MKRGIVFLLVACVFFALVGCGGGGGGGSSVATINTPYAGSWKGSWRIPATSESGAIEFTISSSGPTTGSVYNYSLAKTGVVSGTTDNSGVFSGTVTYPGTSASSLSVSMSLSSGLITGTYIQSGVVGGAMKAFMDSASNSPYAGTWSGTWAATALAQNGSLSIVVATDGKISGTIQNATTGKTAAITGYSDGNGNFGFPLTYSGEPTSVVLGNFGTISGNQLSSVFTQTIAAAEFAGTFTVTK